MEVYGIKPIDSGAVYSTGQVADHTATQVEDKQGQVNGKAQESKELSREEIHAVTDEMNSVVQALDTDIHFKLHEKMHELMVQVVDIKDGKVLKEFPPHELLDTKAKIREYIGALLDKKA